MDGSPGNDSSATSASSDTALGTDGDSLTEDASGVLVDDAPADTDTLTEAPDDVGQDGGPGGSFDDDADAPLEPLITVDDPTHSGWRWQTIVSWSIVALCFVWVLITVHPEAIFRNTTPTGGDMGAHVWGPRYLMDNLLPHLRLTGWTPDWYAGFPAYVFYMVIPSLVVVLLTVGPPVWASPFLLAAVAVAAVAVHRRVRSRPLRTFLWISLGILAMLCVPIPYNISFKIVTVLGLLTLPIVCYAVGKAAKLPFPGPPILAIGATAYVFESAFTILGGNLFSTMAGEFAFSISLSLAIAYLAVLFKGMRTGREKALGAVLFALVFLCHVIPWMFIVGATLLMIFVRREDRTPWWDSSTIGRWAGAGVVAVTLLVLWGSPGLFPIVGSLAALVLFVSFDRRAFRWAIIVIPVGALVSAFWTAPFYLDSAFMNDMGWEKYTEYSKYLWPDPTVFNMPLRNVVFALAGLGIVLSMVHRVRLGWFLALMVMCTAWAFRFAPQWRLWNARILPFYLLCLYLLAALAVALIIRSIALVVGDLTRRREEPVLVGIIGAFAALAVVFVVIGGGLRILPGGSMQTDAAAAGGQVYTWAGLKFPTLNGGSSWALYNFQGLEGRADYPEYKSIIDTMGKVGKTEGCGRAMWEYEPKLDRFGTPMALMLLPYFTNSCIGSMEGLYFEASSTTPFHFINQSELSTQPSRAQRDLPYPNFDMQNGISHLQMLGVKYYMATSSQAIAAAKQDPRLTQVAAIGPFQDSREPSVQHNWVVFEVADSGMVTPLTEKPAVLKNTDDHIDGWVYAKDRPKAVAPQTIAPKLPGPAIKWYLDPTKWDVPLATSGPSDWPRIDPSDTDPPAESVPAAKVSNVKSDDDTISFDVDKVGTPVLVKMSYFPNWHASGATGPYRVSPNQMVVVPTSKHVELHYGTTNVDNLGWFLTITGLVLVGILAVREDKRRRAEDVLFASDPPEQ